MTDEEYSIRDCLNVMIDDYDINYEDRLTLTEYKKMIIQGIDENFEKAYNKYIEERRNDED